MNDASLNNPQVEIDLLELLHALWVNKFKLIITFIVCGALAFAVTYFLITPMYTSSVYLYANNNKEPDTRESISSSDLSASIHLVDTYSAIITREVVLNQAIQKLGLQTTPGALAKKINIASEDGTEVFKLSVTDPDPKAARDIANAVATIATVKIEEVVEGCTVKIVDVAKLPQQISSPNYVKNTAVGALAGFMLCALIIIVINVMDTQIKSEDDFALWNLPVLGNIPNFENVSSKNGYGYGRKA